MKKSFLSQIFKHNSSLFYAIMLFMSGTIFTNLFGWQITPFFVWGMYSEKEIQKNNYPVYRITVNDSLQVNYTSGFSDGNRFYLTSPLQLYTSIKNNNGADPTAIFLQKKLKEKFSFIEKNFIKIFNGKNEYTLFLPWYKKYLEQTLQMPVHNFTIELLSVRYDAENNLKIYSTQLIDRFQ